MPEQNKLKQIFVFWKTALILISLYGEPHLTPNVIEMQYYIDIEDKDCTAFSLKKSPSIMQDKLAYNRNLHNKRVNILSRWCLISAQKLLLILIVFGY